jgi:thymidylate synthase
MTNRARDHLNPNEQGYLDLMRRILDEGTAKEDRTGTGTLSLFGQQLRFDLSAGFPLLTTKRMHLKSIVHELIWFLRGETNVAYLRQNGVTIWDEWADENGDLGPVYGKQWRYWSGDVVAADVHPRFTDRDQLYGEVEFKRESIDQIANLVELLRRDPYSRRAIVTAWNPADQDKVALAWCHAMFQCNMRPMTVQERVDHAPAAAGAPDDHGVPRFWLDLSMYQRSADYFLGVPFNIASYAILTHVLARCLNAVPGDLIISFGDVHLYNNHVSAARTQLDRNPLPPPELVLQRPLDNPMINPWDLQYTDVVVRDYICHPAIPAPVAV